MREKLLLVILFVLLLFSSQVFAQGFAIGAKVSTLGISFELDKSITNNLNVKAGGAFFSYSQDGGGGTDDYTYNAKLDLSSFFLLADWFPFGNSIRLTGGALINLNEANIALTPTDSYKVGGDTYTPKDLGVLSAKIDFNKVSPYIGLGLGNPTSGSSGLKFTFDIGTIYQGAPTVDLSATGLIEPSAAPDQEAQLEDNLNWFKWYPVVSFGLMYKF